MDRYSKGTKFGIVGALFGVLASGILLLVPITRYSQTSTDGSTTTGWGPAGIAYLFGDPNADPALFFWGMIILGTALVGGYGAVSERRILVWIITVVLLGITILGLMSIGLFIAPAALLFLLASVWLKPPKKSAALRE